MKKSISLASVALCALFVLASAAQAQTNGAFSSYLVGTYEQRFNAFTVIQVINPTTNNLKVKFFFYDDKEELKKCVEETLTPKDIHEILVPTLGLSTLFGVVKVVSYEATAGGSNKLARGIVGYHRHCFWGVTCFESNLAAMPEDVAAAEAEASHDECEELGHG